MSKIALFNKLNIQSINDLGNCLSFVEKTYLKGEVIISEGDETKYLGLIKDGIILLSQIDLWGNENLLTFLHPNDIFLESFALAKRSVSVNAIAHTNTTIIYIDANSILTPCSNRCAKHQQLIHNLVDIIAKKNINLTTKINIVNQRTTKDKLLAYLSMLAKEAKSNSFTLPLSKTKLALYLSINRSAMVRELGNLAKEKILTINSKDITLHINN